MIKAKIYKKGEVCALELEGHSDSAPCGQDLVCAAVSSLAFALVRFFEKEGRGMGEVLLERGMAKIYARPGERTDCAFELAECFLSLLEENYPDNVKLSADYGEKGEKS